MRRVKRLEVMAGQRVEVELLAQVPEEALRRPARGHGASDLPKGHLWVRGDYRTVYGARLSLSIGFVG